jgi:hypothetical protein
MIPESIVVSRELAERIAEAGIEQGWTGFFWYNFGSKEKPNWKIDIYPQEHRSCDRYRAFTFNEIWKQLPSQIFITINEKLYCLRLSPRFLGYYPLDKSGALWDKDYRNTTIQDAAAELWLWVKENGYDSQD